MIIRITETIKLLFKNNEVDIKKLNQLEYKKSVIIQYKNYIKQYLIIYKTIFNNLLSITVIVLSF